MATWIAHLRIAERLLDIYSLDEANFLAGSIGPDSGVPNEDWSQFDPPKSVTHWIKREMKEGVETRFIDDEGFYRQYVLPRAGKVGKEEMSFLLGYYSHLLSDTEWSQMQRRLEQEQPEKFERLKQDPKFIWEIKEDWYGLDYQYLRENPDSIFFRSYMNIRHVPDYLDYFPKGAFENRLQYIVKDYLDHMSDVRERYIFFTEAMMEEYIENTVCVIEKDLDEKGLCERKKD